MDPDPSATDALRERWDSSRLRERLDQPIERATTITRRTLGWFPIRVWRHFLRHNGFLLAASISYQSLFALFATIYTAFAVVGLWLGGSSMAIDALIDVVNSYIPGLISGSGPVSPSDVADIARNSGSVLAVTGAVALAVAIWTAIGFVTFTRRAVRDIFGLPFDTRNYVLLKLRDFGAALLFGLVLVLGAALGLVAGGIVRQLFDLFEIPYESTTIDVLSRLASVLVAIVINAAALTALIRFLTGTALPWRKIIPGSIFGGTALSVLQLGAGFLAVYSPTNPLLATFSVLIGFLLWLRLAGIVILVAASWVAVSAADDDIPLEVKTEEERRADERRALRVVAEAQLRDAEHALAEAGWWKRVPARRDVNRARELLRRLDAEERAAR
ncbi:YihY/virulence factor BrkB family protein [Microbacterium sp. AISO3]|uniref:YihY/virulence factor BrkB family protein n=1 Tax=Microbacterium TaxID=33882 RepID=UPI00090384B3|nr:MULTISPECIES: YihY/virulence factor BrkB family protein [Microbacterium]APF35307.1 ribonuclease BN [Microbacterium paludicola]OWP21642.1 YihY/virulence factor BrkB family protein [Microbacterium sp. AISO3]QCR41131.1 YihY/virulence factor BrkB family protein [Microbacterium sp. SGAir0570]